MTTKLLTRVLADAEAGGTHSNMVRAFSGLRMAFIPNPRAMVAPALAAILRAGD